MTDAVGRRQPPATRRISSLAEFVTGRRILVTGHSGFKGGWLCEWLLRLGADVSGISLPPAPDSLGGQTGLFGRIRHIICDIRDSTKLVAAIREINPELIIHMAAQALVRRSYREPGETWSTNVIGTLNLLAAAGAVPGPVAVVAVTTDKVYRDRGWEYSYRETDELGGRDPTADPRPRVKSQ